MLLEKLLSLKNLNLVLFKKMLCMKNLILMLFKKVLAMKNLILLFLLIGVLTWFANMPSLESIHEYGELYIWWR